MQREAVTHCEPSGGMVVRRLETQGEFDWRRARQPRCLCWAPSHLHLVSPNHFVSVSIREQLGLSPPEQAERRTSRASS